MTVGWLGSFEGITRVAFFSPVVVGLYLTHTVHCCVGASVTPEQRSLGDAFLNSLGFAPPSERVPRIKFVPPSLRTVTTC